MKKKIIFLLLTTLLSINIGWSQPITIAEARALGEGSTVTVTGIVTNGSEFGSSLRYFQDASGGLAGYSSTLSSVKRGDSILITGTLKLYANLMELDPVTSLTVVGSNYDLPDPEVIYPNDMIESREGTLVKIENLEFDSPSGTFAGGSNYSFTANGQSGTMRTNNNSDIVGEPVPTGMVSLTGIVGQYDWDDPNDGYQLLIRDKQDLVSGSSINFTSTVEISALSTSGFTLSWTTDVNGTSGIYYGNTPDLEMTPLTDMTSTTSHSISITGANPSEVFYVKAFSVNGEDTTKTSMLTYITQSTSSGDIKVYFNRAVDHSVSTGTDAIQLDNAIDDTLIKYIDRAKESIDFTIYNFNNTGISNISTALNAAHSRGVVVRVIYDSEAANTGIDELDAGIGKLPDTDGIYPDYGIMHNKFVVFDANSADPDDSFVWTGATNFTDGQINTDPNNVIIIQDQSLAISYQMEFNEMFGSTGALPDAVNARFGPDKTDNTPHEFIIDGKRVESYFSPSDGTTARILDVIRSTESDLSIATMLITRSELGYAISDQADAGVTTKVLVNTDANCSETVVGTLTDALGVNFLEMGESGIMHHKYMIADQSNPASDPMVLTGCHNWSSSAELRNDENTLIIHDAEIANIFYQEFVERFSHGQLIVSAPNCSNDYATTDKGVSVTTNVIENDDIPGSYTLTIIDPPANGTADIDLNRDIIYTPASEFLGLDTIFYKACLTADPSLCGEARLVVLVQESTGIGNAGIDTMWEIYPNPVGEFLNLNIGSDIAGTAEIEIINLNGRMIKKYRIMLSKGVQEFNLDLPELSKGIYFVRFSMNDSRSIKKMIVQ